MAAANVHNKKVVPSPEDWDMPERILMDIEGIVDGIEESALRVIASLAKESQQYDVVGLLAAISERIKEIKDSLNRETLTAELDMVFPDSTSRLRMIAGESGNQGGDVIKMRQAGPAGETDPNIASAEQRGFTLEAVIEMLKDPSSLAKRDLKDIYYYLMVMANLTKDSTANMAAEVNRSIAGALKVATKRTVPISKNAFYRAWSRKAKYTNADIKAIGGLRILAERLLRVQKEEERQKA